MQGALSRDSVSVVEDQREPQDERNGPQTRMQCERWNRPNGAERKERGVDGNAGPDQRIDMLLQPIEPRRLWFKDEPEIGGNRGDTDGGHTKHQRFADPS